MSNKVRKENITGFKLKDVEQDGTTPYKDFALVASTKDQGDVEMGTVSDMEVSLISRLKTKLVELDDGDDQYDATELYAETAQGEEKVGRINEKHSLARSIAQWLRQLINGDVTVSANTFSEAVVELGNKAVNGDLEYSKANDIMQPHRRDDK